MKKKKIMTSHGPLEWIYELEAGKCMRDLYQVLLDETDYDAEYWEDAGVLEVTPQEGGHIDFEQSEEEDVLWVTLSSKEYISAKQALMKIHEIFGGACYEDK